MRGTRCKYIGQYEELVLGDIVAGVLRKVTLREWGLYKNTVCKYIGQFEVLVLVYDNARVVSLYQLEERAIVAGVLRKVTLRERKLYKTPHVNILANMK